MPVEDLIGSILFRYIGKIDHGSQLLTANYFNKLDPSSFRSRKGICRSSYSEARSKLSWEVFPYLLEKLDCYDDKWKGHRVRAVDGTRLNLPRSSEVLKQFPILGSHFGDPHYPAARLVAASSIESSQITHCKIGNKHLSERGALLELLGEFENDSISLLDRGFQGKDIWFSFDEKKQFFVGRLKIHGRGVLKDIDLNRLDKTIEIFDNLGRSMKARIIKSKKTKNGKLMFLITNLLDRVKYTRKDILNLYRKRQAVEDSFLQLKQRLKLDLTLRVKKINNVFQEIFGAVLAQALIANLKYQIQKNKVSETRRVSFKGAQYAAEKFMAIIFSKNPEKIRCLLQEIIFSHYHLNQEGRSYPRHSLQPTGKWIVEKRRAKRKQWLRP